ncbi:hypothetical protein ABH926_000128 [Catenulispora sp. GP43]|uniref:hypothetical protein n=1 Tax=Catenulispora sp. GP43 TaxID=3156263 RepID=UPI0035186305
MDDDELTQKVVGLMRLAYAMVKDSSSSSDAAFAQEMRKVAGDIGRPTLDPDATEEVRAAANTAAAQVSGDLTRALGLALGLFGVFAAAIDREYEGLDVPAFLDHLAGHQ